jgi:hypothetical protein
MSGGELLLLVCATALASSLATLGLGWLLFQRWMRPGLESRLAAFADLLEARVKAGAEAAGQGLLEPVRARVQAGAEDAAAKLLPRVRAELTAGVRDAAADSLPALREEVRKGFIEALSADALLDRTARGVARTGASLVESGLSLLRPARPGGRDEPPRGAGR